MSLIKRNFPWTDLSDFFEPEWPGSRFGNGDSLPAVNVIENEGSYEIEVAAPGYKKEDFHVVVENGVMNISAKSENEKEEKNKKYTRREFSSSSFTRSFTLPENVNPDDVKAKFADGVLRLTLKKSEKETSKKKEISIN